MTTSISSLPTAIIATAPPLQDTPPAIKSLIQTFLHGTDVVHTQLLSHLWNGLRGNDGHLDLSSTKITDEDLQAIINQYKKNKPPLNSLNLSGCGITDKALGFLADLPLIKLNLSDCYGITNNGLKHLSKLPLTHLDLSGNKNISDLGLMNLINLALIELKLRGCINITDKGLTYIARSSLKHLNLSRCKLLSNTGLSYLASLALTTLSLSECRKITDQGLDHLAAMPLTDLDLSFCPITDKGLYSLRNLPLKTLVLFGCDSIGNTPLVPLTYFHSLESLNIRRCVQVSNDTLAQLVGHPLKHLKLSADNGISDYGFSFLSAFPLEELTIYDGHNLTDDGMSYLTPLQNLKSLYIEYAPISGKGLKHIAQLPISTLYLECETLKDQDFVCLSSLPLKKLKLVTSNDTEHSIATHLSDAIFKKFNHTKFKE